MVHGQAQATSVHGGVHGTGGRGGRESEKSIGVVARELDLTESALRARICQAAIDAGRLGVGSSDVPPASRGPRGAILDSVPNPECVHYAIWSWLIYLLVMRLGVFAHPWMAALAWFRRAFVKATNRFLDGPPSRRRNAAISPHNLRLRRRWPSLPRRFQHPATGDSSKEVALPVRSPIDCLCGHEWCSPGGSPFHVDLRPDRRRFNPCARFV